MTESCAETIDAGQGYLDLGEGIRLFYRVVGSGPEKVIIPFHTLMGPHFEQLAEGRTLVFYDMRGRGRSAPVREPSRLGIDFEVKDLERIRQHFGLDRVSLIGFSYLGGVGALYAMAYPQRVNRLVQIGTMALHSGTNHRRKRPTPNPILFGKFDALREAGLESVDPAKYCRAYWEAYLPLYVGNPRDVDKVAQGLDFGCDLENEWPQHFMATLGHVFRRFQQWDWTPGAVELSAPTLIIHGTKDRVAPIEAAREWAAAIPDARLYAVPGGGHLVWAEAPDEVLPAVDQFLNGEWPDEAIEVLGEGC